MPRALLAPCVVLALLAAGSPTSLAQPLELPSPNVPSDVRGINPSFRLAFGTHEWGDYNGDGELDFVILGRLPASSSGTVSLYGDVLRSSPSRPEPTSPIIYDYFSSRAIRAVWLSDAAWGDYDNDGDLDLAVLGATTTTGNLEPQTNLYRSAGNVISLSDETSLPGVYAGSLDWGDYDNDGDLDLALSGIQADGQYLTTVFRNNGGGQFEDVSPGLVPVALGTVDWVDLDLDGDRDLFVSGGEADGPTHATVYRNDGNGSLVDWGMGLAGVSHSSADWADFDSDGDPDLLLTGFEVSPLLGSGVTRLYRNDSAQLTEIPALFPGLYYGDAGWIDYDSDGDLDVAVTGLREPFGSRVTNVCIQEPAGTFTCSQIQVTGLGAQPVPGIAYGTVSWADYDHDTDPDLFVTGDAGATFVTTFYRNAGSGLNTPPQPPSALQSTVAGPAVELSWAAAVDPDGPDAALTYSVRVGTASGGVNIVSPHADPISGTRYVLEEGNAGARLSFRLSGLPPGTYYWSVQAIDNSRSGSPFAGEETFVVGGL